MSNMNDLVTIEVPKVDPLYVPMANAVKYNKILSKGLFFPTYTTGPSGTGKTYSWEQEAAIIKKPLLRVNMTSETDESDLIGSFRLINGETVFSDGPVVQAMEAGCGLLLDEIDLANPARVMCLQSILEGNPYFNKKTKRLIRPKDGFTIIATANTKGRGDDSAKFISANIHNEAMLERFAVTFNQGYTDEKTEKEILMRLSKSLQFDVSQEEEYIDSLISWANEIREGYLNGTMDDVISTRRLTHILKTHSIFEDRDESVEACINRFEDTVKDAFMNLWNIKKPGAVDVQEQRITEPDLIDLDAGDEPFARFNTTP